VCSSGFGARIVSGRSSDNCLVPVLLSFAFSLSRGCPVCNLTAEGWENFAVVSMVVSMLLAGSV
jgi:hypothetical protein